VPTLPGAEEPAGLTASDLEPKLIGHRRKNQDVSRLLALRFEGARLAKADLQVSGEVLGGVTRLLC
jgi:hypothetical protein